MRGNMMDYPLTLLPFAERAARLYPSVEIVSRMPDDSLHWGDSRAEVHAHAVEQVPDLEPEHVKSFTFIPSRLDDNRILTESDPSYKATLLSIPKVEREKLLGGNWNVILPY